MFFSVDRIVSGQAELIGEDGKPLRVPASMLPPGAKNGDMLWYENGSFTAAPDKTAERRQRVAGMLGQLLHHPAEEE